MFYVRCLNTTVEDFKIYFYLIIDTINRINDFINNLIIGLQRK